MPLGRLLAGSIALRVSAAVPVVGSPGLEASGVDEGHRYELSSVSLLVEAAD
jgi:hypothetical protein